MIFELFFTLTLLLLTILLWAIWYGRRNYGVLEHCGFPVIPPTLFLGSDPTFYNDVQHLKDIERFHKYGTVWGMYFGQTPQVYVADPELIRLIMVKDTDYFYDRPRVDVGSPLLNELLGWLPAEQWKKVRSMLTPLFSTAKLKSMSAMMSDHAQEFVKDLKVEIGDTRRIKFDCKLRLSCWLIDMFAQSTLGVKLPNRKDPKNEFAVALRKLIGEDIQYGPLYSLATTFPFLVTLAPTFDNEPAELLENIVRRILNARQHTPKKATDFVDILNDLMSKVGSDEFRKINITELTIISQAVNFFLGGYETSSTTISHFLYYIAQNPQIQKRLHEEIVSKFGTSGSTPITTDHDSINEENMPYLAACLNESIRLSASAFRPHRICTKDWSSDGIKIKKGTMVIIPAWAIHRDPKYFPNPDKFIPERFLAQNKSEMHPYSFLGFGHGPKNCIGMRFAYDSIKTFLIHFLLNFKIELRPDTALNYKKGNTLIFVTFDGLYLDIVER